MVNGHVIIIFFLIFLFSQQIPSQMVFGSSLIIFTPVHHLVLKIAHCSHNVWYVMWVKVG